MTDRAAPPPLDELLARREWVRRFARTLARDDATADDLAQDTMVAAIEHPPRDAAAPAGWLRRVLLRRAMNRSRGERRREERETRFARPETSPSPADVVATAESHRRVVEAVLALDEPYRTTVLLRFFEDLPPRDVAARMGVPVETVRARVRRAVEQLRARLDEEHGGRRAAWLAPLLADGRDAARRTVPLAALLAMAAGVVAVTATLVLNLGASDGDGDAQHAAVVTDDASAVDSTGSPSANGSTHADDAAHPTRRRPRSADDSATTAAAPAAAAPASKWRPFEVRVVDATGAPVEGVEIRVRRDGEGSWTARTGSDGRAGVSIPTAASVRKIEIADPAASGGPVSAVKSETRGDESSTIVVDRLAWIAGRVTGPEGNPVGDGFMRWQGSDVAEGQTDGRGAFRLVVPRDTTGTLLLTGQRGVDLGDQLVGEVEDVAAGRTDVVLVAHRAGRDKRLVVRCVTGAGTPLEGVDVGLVTTIRGERRVRAKTDAEGRAVFEHLPDWRHYAYVHEDYGTPRPWEKDGWATPPGFTFVRPGGEELVLRFETGRWIKGRVLDDNGRAVPGSSVTFDLPGDRRVGVNSKADGSFAVFVPADVAGAIRVRAEPPRVFVSDTDPPVVRATAEEMVQASLRPAERDGVRPGDEGIELRLRAPTPDGR